MGVEKALDEILNLLGANEGKRWLVLHTRSPGLGQSSHLLS
jgi:hypothetical protein